MTTSEVAKRDRPQPPAVSYTAVEGDGFARIAAGLAVLFLAVLVWVMLQHDAEVRVVTLTEPAHRFTLLEEDDLVMKTVEEAPAAGALSKLDDAVGKYTVKDLGSGAVLTNALVAEPSDPARLENSHPVTLSKHAGQVTGGTLRRGDVVGIYDPASDPPGRLVATGVPVLAARVRTDAQFVLTLALPPSAYGEYLRHERGTRWRLARSIR